jgi:hypothetical protein
MSSGDDWLHHFAKDVMPKIHESALTIAIVSGEPDAKVCFEVGASVLLDKPLVLVVPKGRSVSAALKRVASVIVEGDAAEPGFELRLKDAVRDVLKNDRRAAATEGEKWLMLKAAELKRGKEWKR